MSESASHDLVLKERFPVLALRDIVVFPGMVVPLFVGREKSIKALDAASKDSRQIMLVTQLESILDDPTPEELYSVGTLGNILQVLRLPDGTVKVLIEGIKRGKITSFTQEDPFYEVIADEIEETLGDEQEVEALIRTALNQFDQYAKLNKKFPTDLISSIGTMTDPSRLADTVAAHATIKVSDKQKLLETTEVNKRLEQLLEYLEKEIGVVQAEKRIRSRVKSQMEKMQREYYLNEQLKAIQKELGEGEEGKDEISEIEERIRTTKLTKEAKERALAEVKKLRQMSPMSAEATVVRNYLDWLLSIPWSKRSKIKKDLKLAKKTLDKDHYGLEKVKERIVEYLAVQNRVDKIKGPILCLVGPPGVGKTSLGKSIATAVGRQFVRMSLGGVRDESEIRGHRRTYIGSMPGKIIQGMKKAKNINPLFLLDEIDKLGADWRGDPSSALLEVLDPEQNNTFNDHYLEVDYDLSDVMFVTTANTLNMPQPLLDRMEVIRLSGYTEDEKVEIAKRHLIPKQTAMNGLKKGEIMWRDDAIRMLIRHYTREAGVRNLEREIATTSRKVLTYLLTHQSKKSILVTKTNLEKFAGIQRYHHGEAEQEDQVGVTTGLAWTEVGGELLSIEAVTLPGKGKMTITGKLGDVMQESIQAASSFVRSRSYRFGIASHVFDKLDIHIHVPEGATPKDGPSAGVAMCTSIVSVLTGIPVRKDVAMTGEITLRGRVLPIGGLKEKLLAALRGGIKAVLIPEENGKDLPEIPDNVKKGLKIILVKTADEVLEHALAKPPTPIPAEDFLLMAAQSQAKGENAQGNEVKPVAH